LNKMQMADEGACPIEAETEPGRPLCGGLISAVVGKRGVAIYPGQSAEEVLRIAAVIERELDGEVDHYHAREVARQILLAQGFGHKA
jgi:hypothetical protein